MNKANLKRLNQFSVFRTESGFSMVLGLDSPNGKVVISYICFGFLVF